MNNSDIKQLFKFYGMEYDTNQCYDLDTYIANLEQLVNIQAHQIERLQKRLTLFCIILTIIFGVGCFIGWLIF